MMTLEHFLATCLAHLKIARPVNLMIYEGDATPEGYDAAHWFEKGSHNVEIAEHPTRDFLSCLAHELIHAALEEQAPDAPWHGFAFQHRAASLEKHLQSQGWQVNKIFWLGFDK